MAFVVDKYGTRRELRNGEIVQDGERLVVNLQLIDHRPPDVHDGMGGAAGHKPGYLFPSSPGDADVALKAARAAYVKNLNNSWRNPSTNPYARGEKAAADARSDYIRWLTNAWRTP